MKSAIPADNIAVASIESNLRDRVILLGVAGAVVLCSVAIGAGIGSTGWFFVIQAVFVFGGVLSYCATAWPKWYRQKPLRTRILASYFGMKFEFVERATSC